MRVIVTNRARNDLLKLFDYNSKISIKIDKKIRSYFQILEYFPYIGRYVPEILNHNYREQICEKFRIIYFISRKENIIYIQYIFSSKQNPNTFFNLHTNKFL